MEAAAPALPRTRPPRRRTAGEVWRHLVLGALLVFTFYPFLFLIMTSLKSFAQFNHNFWLPAWPLEWGNYQAAFNAMYRYVLNSAFVTITTLVGLLAISSVTAYVFARFQFPGKGVLYYLIISLLMIPGVLTLIPAFMLMVKLRLAGNYGALILPYIAGGQVFAIFIMRGFFASLPEELFEAARIDGASEWHNFRHIALPLSKPILGTVAIMNVIGTWNDYIWPLVNLYNDRLYTLPMGLIAFQHAYYTNWGPLFAGYLLSSLPLLVLFIFTMRYFMRGITSGALKI
jgi:ABC-type glycerol-3-phosphate transport system permease component